MYVVFTEQHANLATKKPTKLICSSLRTSHDQAFRNTRNRRRLLLGLCIWVSLINYLNGDPCKGKMANTEEADRMKLLLIESITTLCRSGINYSTTLKVEGLLAITIDQGDVMVVNVNREYEVPKTSVESTELDSVESGRTTPTGEHKHRESIDSVSGESPVRAHKRPSPHERSSSRKKARYGNDNSHIEHVEGSWSPSDSSSHSHSYPTAAASVSTSQMPDPDLIKAEIKIEIMDSDSDQAEGDSNLSLYDELNAVAQGHGHLVHDPSISYASYSDSGLSQLPGPSTSYSPSDGVTYSQMMPGQAMESPTVVYFAAKKRSCPEKEHDAKCLCCHVFKRKREINRIFQNQKIEKSQRRIRARELPPIPGLPTGHAYRLPQSHQDVCECCLSLRSFRDQEKIRNKRRRSKVNMLRLQNSEEKS